MRREKQEPTPTKGRGAASDMGEDVLEFVRAIDEFKRKNDKPFPTWSEVLGIVQSLGYRK